MVNLGVAPMFKALAVTLGVAALCGVSYFAGAFSTSFNDGLCYSEVISGISAHAQKSIELGGPGQSKQFLEFVESLPVRGYETDCPELLAAINSPGQQTQTR